MKISIRILLFAAFAAITHPAVTSVRADEEVDLKVYLEMFRSDLGDAKRQALTNALKLTDKEAKVFWPIYAEYDAELGKYSERRLAAILDFAKNQQGGTLDDRKARELKKEWFNLQEKRLGLWKKYSGKIERALSATRAAQFVQAEHQVSLLVDLAVTAEMPLIGSQPEAAKP